MHGYAAANFRPKNTFAGPTKTFTMFRAFLFFIIFTVQILSGQTQDSAALISTVTIDNYRKPARLLYSTKSVAVAGATLLEQNMPDRMLESVNLLPGAKMEERSPGSYRLSVRGSTLRSPFGIRNVKVYLDDFSLTDASGNTYLNILDAEIIRNIELYKGPEAGDFGSGTGGTMLLKTSTQKERKAGVALGSYDHYKGTLQLSEPIGRHTLQVHSSYETTQSYREQAALERKFILIKDEFRYGERNEMQAVIFASDFHYETPGGLTLEQMNENPRQARPKTATLPGAVMQQAGIYNKTIFGGLSNVFHYGDFSHFVAVQADYHELRNPFITNYEKRFEQNTAWRTHLNYERQTHNFFSQTRLGYEGARGIYRHRNFDNLQGTPTLPQNFDDISVHSGFVFLSQKLEFGQRLFLDLSASLNMMRYGWENIYPKQQTGNIVFSDALLPTFGISYRLRPDLILRGKLSKGNSAPTTEEVRSSAQNINTALQPEYGWNTEIGVRKQWGNLLFAEVSAFDFNLKNAIVRRQDEAGQEYFVNAGGTVQRGVEFALETRKLALSPFFIRFVKIYFSGNLYDFKFKDYQQNKADFSGNKVTGVPTTSIQGLLNIGLTKSFRLDLAHFYNSSTPLNDANTTIAPSAFTGNASLVYQLPRGTPDTEVKLAVQNMYNTQYSLGYDINAFGNRFYNPAAARNFMISVQIRF